MTIQTEAHFAGIAVVCIRLLRPRFMAFSPCLLDLMCWLRKPTLADRQIKNHCTNENICSRKTAHKYRF